MLNQYKKLMRRCIKLAKKSEGFVSPNPLVGAIVFDDDYRIISEGRHERYGENHAERNAILNSKEDVRGKNIIVNLEPCSHYGKTPPCADLIIEKGIKKVIVGMVDVNPIVANNGIKKLKDAGIEVVVGILEEECKKLNEVFIKNQLEKKPFVVIKTATTLDGKIATKTGSSKWITDEVSRKEVQKLRNKYDAIMTSSSTVIKDNPSMTARIKNGRNPIRIVIDSSLSTPTNSKIYNNDGTKVIIVTGENVDRSRVNEYPNNVEILYCPLKSNHVDLEKAIDLLYEKGVKSILVEAGGSFNNALIQDKLVDRLIMFVAPKILADSNGINFVDGENRIEISQCNNLTILSTKKLKRDIIIIGKF